MDQLDDKNESSLDVSSHDRPQREVVEARYHELLAEQASAPDKVFISGYEMRHLDTNLVFLDEDSREHPRSWTLRKKTGATAIIGGLCFLAPFASTIFAPAVHLVMQDLDITDSTIGALQVSIFLFALALGPLFLAPLSELYGRTVVIHGGNFVFVVFSIGGGFSQTTAQFSICRFFAGVGGSASVAVLGGFVADIWPLAQRPKAAGVIMLGPLLGPVLGPVCGGWMSEGASWRWTLWVPAIASGLLSLLGFFRMPETFAPTVLRRKLKQAQKSQTNDQLYTVLDLQERSTGTASLISEFTRPIIYLVLDPALFLASLYLSLNFGVMYLLLVTFADVFGTHYGHSPGIVGTDLISCGIGMMIGTAATVKVMDAVFKKDESTGKPRYKPESRLISCAVGGFFSAGGLFMYGFSATRTHFIVPLLGCVIFSAGAINIMMAIQLYAIDGFKYSASAFASIFVLRCLFAGAFPLFGEKLFQSLGVDWGVALLAFLVLGLGLPLMSLLYVFGSKLRGIGVGRMNAFVGSKKI